MKTALDDIAFLPGSLPALHIVNQAVFPVYPPRQVALQVKLQGFGSPEGRFLNVGKQFPDFFNHIPVGLHPVFEIFPCVLCKLHIHDQPVYYNLYFRVFPFFSCATDSCNRCRLAAVDNKCPVSISELYSFSDMINTASSSFVRGTIMTSGD